MTTLLADLRRCLGLWRCSSGHHAALEWSRASHRPVPINTTTPKPNAMEMIAASGWLMLAKWNGWCPRCGRPVEWSDSKPMRLDRRGRFVA